jgi:hypothetical protein
LKLEDRLNNPKYASLYKKMFDLYGETYADWFISHQPLEVLDYNNIKDSKWLKERYDDTLVDAGPYSARGAYQKYKDRKITADETKKDKLNKEQTILVIKAFINGNKLTEEQRRQRVAKDATPGTLERAINLEGDLLPYYGHARRPEDVAQVGSTIDAPERAVGSSVIGLTGKPDHKKLYSAIMEVMHPEDKGAIMEIETTPDDIDEYTDKTQLEDLDPNSGPHVKAMPIGYDHTDMVHRDLNRDNDYEMHINKGKISNIVDGLTNVDWEAARDLAIDVEDTLQDPSWDHNKKELLRRLRKKHNLSPYVIDKLLKLEGLSYKSVLRETRNALIEDKYVRPYADKMVKRRKKYGSDKRTKNIIPSISGVI